MVISTQHVPRNVLVFGATGTIGRCIFEKLVLTRASFNRLVIFTSPGTVSTKSKELEAYTSKNVEIIAGDIKDEADILQAYEGIDTVVSALGREAIAAQIPLIRLADKSPSVKWFIPSEFGTDIEYNAASADEYPHQWKLQVRACLRETTNLSYTYIVTGPYADAKPPAFFTNLFPDPRIGTYDVRAKKAVLLGDGHGKISFTTTSDVGKLVVAVLRHPELCHKKALKINSFTTTPAEILAEFERQCGGQKWQVSYTRMEELQQLEAEAVAKKLPYFTLYTLRRIWTQGGTLYEQRDNEKIEAGEMDTLEDAIKLAIEYQLAL